jgi:murein DD-endopeptidase MepM/ murein hydrolase activator NlpD
VARITYYYDTKTSSYERVKTRKIDIVLNAAGLLFLTSAMATGLFLVYDNFFESPRELVLHNEIRELEFYYSKLNKDVESLSGTLSKLERRDDNIYRAVLGAPPIDKSVRDAGIGGVDRYADIREKKLAHSQLVIGLKERVDKLRRKLYIESKSQDEVVHLAEQKEKLYAAIPAIQPIANKQLIALSSGFGMRMHPVYKVKKMHQGIDFSATIGTPVYATADGVVSRVDVKTTGYGKMVVINHGFGYTTRYAHLHGFAVKKGDSVKRGDLIGYVGNTGLTTAPNLHYEVLINHHQVDPVHYFFNDLTAAEYEKILELASEDNQSLGL